MTTFSDGGDTRRSTKRYNHNLVSYSKSICNMGQQDLLSRDSLSHRSVTQEVDITSSEFQKKDNSFKYCHAIYNSDLFLGRSPTF